MPSLVRKIVIFAAVDGLIIQPLAQRGQRPVPAAKIAYKDNIISPALKVEWESERIEDSFEAFGIIGLLTVAKSSFLISITRRQQVAQIQGKPIYVITDVALTPLSSRQEAESSISHTQRSLQKKAVDGHATDDSDTEGDEADLSAAISDDVDDEEPSNVVLSGLSDTSHKPGEHKRTSSVAEDVLTRKGSYGRFASKWFSKKGWTVDQRRNLGMSVPENESVATKSASVETKREVESSTKASLVAAGLQEQREQKDGDVAQSLLPKLLRTTQILFGTSRSFFFSYDYDITRSFSNRRVTTSELPLHTEVDPLFFWNRHIIQPFVDAGQIPFVLPLMQGFVGQRSFEMDTNPPDPVIDLDGAGKSSIELADYSTENDSRGKTDVDSLATAHGQISRKRSSTERTYLLTLVSRRSVKRAGLRYLRRGVDEEGNTANGVETEQILSESTWAPSSKIYSFVQIRGSIPIYFSQSPYSFKPVPQIQHSAETNFQAFKRHFDSISDRYGSIQVANLVEKHGNEAIVGEQYEKNMDRLNHSDESPGRNIGFEWFDFHAICRGMKFENVSLLMDALEAKLDAFGRTVAVDGQLLSRQSGVLRTNCMDCLDRTNVVQSACGRKALEQQLKNEGIDFGLQVDQTAHFFNTLWADNGDAISKQYASTAAMKGDFTRTRKRDYKGALTDMGISISRFYSGLVNDYFSQAAIDFLLGNVTSLVFEDFEENLMSSDPAVSMHKMRQQAIDVSQKIVIANEHEELIGGWTLLTPHAPNSIKSMPLEEAVLLLTNSALYATRFDWNIEKVTSFERVDLKHIVSIKYGTYITSTLSSAQADEKRNVGFVVTYKAGSDDITRVNTRSMSTVQPAAGDTMDGPTVSGLTSLIGRPAPTEDKILAWKALPSRSAVSEGREEPRLSEIESVKTICSDIERMVLPWKEIEADTERKNIVENSDIISLAEAKKSTGLLDQLGHSLKKLVWA